MTNDNWRQLVMASSLAKQFEGFSAEEVCDYLRQQAPKLDKNVFEKLLEHKIDGEVFVVLNEEYLREIAPLLGDRLKIKKIINAILVSTVCDKICNVIVYVYGIMFLFNFSLLVLLLFHRLLPLGQMVSSQRYFIIIYTTQ